MDYSYNSKFFKNLYKEISDLINGDIEDCDEDKFNNLALREFQYQFYNNDLYRNFCQEKFNIENPRNVDTYTEIPAVTSEHFKLEGEWISFPRELLPEAKLFETSGTTSGKKGKFWMDSKTIELFDSAIIKSTKEYCLPDVDRIKSYNVASPPHTIPNAGIGYDMRLVEERFATECHYFIDKYGLHAKKLTNMLKDDEKTGTPLAIMGPPFGFVLFYDWCKEKGIDFKLAEGSRLVDGGGYRGFTREVPKPEFFSMMSELFGIPDSHIINNYACSETNLTIYDNVLRNEIKGRDEPRYKPNYPWTRLKVVDMNRYPDETVFLERGEKGLLRYYALTNLASVICIQTDDIGELIGNGFEIYGKSEPIKPPTVGLQLV